MDSSHKTILITGGTMGIGAATARRLTADGARVLIVDNNRAFAEELFRLIWGPGHIVNLSSMGGYMARPNESVYDATKAGMTSFTRSMAYEFATHGIRVNAVVPGAIITEMHTGTAPDRHEKRREFQEYELELALLRRWGRPEGNASVIAFLLSDDASYITGTTIHADGGVIVS